jgi:hypothetical protein
VTICPFDVLVSFLKCVQFLKPCVQFLMDTILNLAIVQFLVKEKRDMLLLHTSLILRKWRHACSMRVSYLRKREMHTLKRTANRKFSTGRFLHRTPVPVWTHAACKKGGPRGAQAIFDLLSLLTVICLKTGVHVSYPVFTPKPSTQRIHDTGSIVPHIQLKGFTNNQLSRIKYDYYYINSVSKEYDDSQWNETTEDSITP